MPLLGNQKSVTFTPLPTEEQLEKLDKDQVFYISFTGEIFTTFLEYFDRMLLYRKKCWTCSESFKTGLTFKEALESERKCRLKAEPNFPGVWIKPALEIIHLNKSTLNDLIDEVYDYFRGTRFVSETVFVDVPTATGGDRSVERAVIIKKVDNSVPATLEKPRDKRQLQREAREALEDNSRVPEDLNHYQIQLYSRPSQMYIVAPNQMRRPRQILSKITLKKYIKDVAKKDKWNGAPWVVKHNLVQKYGLVTEIPLDPNDPANKDKRGKLIKPATLFDNPIEDTELLVKPLIRKVEEGEESLPVRPLPHRDFGSVSSEHVLSLVRSYNFLQIFGGPLHLYPFQFDPFLRHLSHTNYNVPSEIMAESFGALLALACQEYQAKADSSSLINPYYMGAVRPDSNGDYSTVPHVNEAIGKVMEALKTFSAHEKVAVDQWYKWRPGQWGFAGGSKKSSMDHIKAWPVALFGLIKDTIGHQDILKWNLLLKLLAPPPDVPKDEGEEEKEESEDGRDMQVDSSSEMDVEPVPGEDEDELDQLPESDDADYDHPKGEEEEEDELEWEGEDTTAAPSRGSIRGTSTRPVLPSEQIKPPKPVAPKVVKASKSKSTKKDSKAKAAPPVMGFADLCNRMEKSFWNFTANERVYLLTHIIDELLQDSKLLSKFKDECFDKETELRKEQREIKRIQRGIAATLAELDKANKKLVIGAAVLEATAAVEDTHPHFLDSDGSDDEALDGRPVRNTRLSRAKKIQKTEVKAEAISEEEVPAVGTNSTEDPLKIQEEKRELEAKEAQLQRRYQVVEFEIRKTQAAIRLKCLGRDRFCNRYWYFDASHGSVSMDAITKTPLDPSVIEKPVGADPDIPYDYSTGVLFIEEFGVSTLTPALTNELSDLRTGQLDGSWGYYSTPEEFEQLKLWLDRRGIREASLFNRLENYSDYILDGLTKRTEAVQEEIQKSQDAMNARKSLRLSTRNELMDEAFGYENWWQLNFN